VSIEILCQNKEAYSKILDIKEAAKKNALKGFEAVIIDELSFNQYPGYLLHSKSLSKIEVINNQRAEIPLPEYSLRYSGKLCILRNTSYLKDLQNQRN
jgi:hypothetical protein